MILHLILFIVLGGVFMNKKRMMQIIASISLIGGLTGAGKTFAYDNVKSTEVEIGLDNAKLINESVDLIAKMCNGNWVYPCLKIADSGTITVSKSNWRFLGPGEKSREIGENFELDMDALKEWWKKDIAEFINNFYYKSKDVLLMKGFRKLNFGTGAKFINKIETLKEKGLLEEAISQYIGTKWEEQLGKFQEQIEKKRAEAESKQLDS